MLVLSRRTEESIMIGDDIEIKIIQVRGSGDQATVRLGIVAPKNVTVLRKEVYLEVASENRRAAGGGPVKGLEQLAEALTRLLPGPNEQK